MIFYYSATGNSAWFAREIAEKQGERLISVTDALRSGSALCYEIGADETIGFVFPVHAWNPPDTLLDFISRMEIKGFDKQYVFAAATCGDSTGNTMQVLEKALHKKGLSLQSKWEIAMPNNYLPLQDVDSPELEKKKLDAAKAVLKQMQACIAARRVENRLIADKYAAFKTGFIGFFFRTFGKSSRAFYTTDACSGCGMCEKICLKSTISMQDKRPVWGKKCDQCYACINRCPEQAIQYGSKTESRGRYCHPSLKSGRK